MSNSQGCKCIAAAAAKSLQSCPILCDPIDGSPKGSPVPGILQARTLEWDAISFSNAWKWKVKVKSLSCVWPSGTPWTAAFQAPPPGGPTPGPWTATMHGWLGTGPHSRRWEAGEREKLHLYLWSLPIACITIWALIPVRSVAALESHRSVNCIVNCICKGSRLRAPYKNYLKPFSLLVYGKMSSMKPVLGVKSKGTTDVQYWEYSQ